MTGSPLTGYTTAEVPRFHVGDNVIVTLSGLPTSIEPHQEPIKEDGTITMPISVMFKLRAKPRASFKMKYITFMCRNCIAISLSRWFLETVFTTSPVKSSGPGRQLYAGLMTVTKAITTAGDFTDFANHSVWLIRANGQRIKVNCNKALQTRPRICLFIPTTKLSCSAVW